MKNLKNILKTTYWLHLIIILGFCSTRDLFSMHMTERGKENAQKYIARLPEKEAKKIELAQLKSQENKRGLLIFLDDSEKEMGSISSTLLTALYQEASPIIASTSLLYTLIQQKKSDERNTNVLFDEAEKEYIDLQSAKKLRTNMYELLNKRDSFVKKQNILISRIGFQSERWIIKKINNFLNFLIPVSYLEILNISRDEVKDYASVAPNVVSEVELKLGFKVNHMENFDYESINISTDINISDQSIATQLIPLAGYFADDLDTIFVKRLDYKNSKIEIPEWFILIDGHGVMNYSIADLSFNDFKKLLHFLESRIITKLLIVKSCYAAGINANKVYGEIELETQQYYSFPIIIQGLNDITTLNDGPILDMLDKKRKLITYIDFISFFNKIKVLEGNYSEIIKPICEDFIHNTPQIKLSGIEWFSVMDINKKIVSIGSILVKTRDSKKSLDVVNFFKKDPEVILLYTNDIPFELVINSSNIKAIISMVSPKLTEENSVVITKIKKISSRESSCDHILAWFRFIAKSNHSKSFFIDEINSSKYNFELIKDIYAVGTDEGGMRVYCKNKDGVLCMANFYPGSDYGFIYPLESGSDDEKFYQEKIQEQYLKLCENAKKAREVVAPEHIEKIQDVLIKQRARQMQEAQK